MSRYRYAAKVDKNQAAIVKALREIPGVTVQTGHDDLLIGYQKKTFWIELKNPNEINKKGQVSKKKCKTQQKQKELLETWRGHYSICWTLDQILTEIGI